jgi:carbamoyl-phosphate synthase small subunit
MDKAVKALLVLEDGRTFEGLNFGAKGTGFGEIVFNTSMTGYQEILTDPSYAGQIICMTYPHIGNYGVNQADVESRKPWAEGLVVREASKIYSNWRAAASLDDYLRENGIVGIEHIDTRALVRHIRDKGAMRAAVSTEILDSDELLKVVLNGPSMHNLELASKVTVREQYEVMPDGEPLYHIVAYDFGVKFNSLRKLKARGCKITVVPAETKAEQTLELKPDGIFLSNGPGDPSAMKEVSQEAKKLIDSGKAVFGICLGHQLIAQALGGKTFKLKFGHRGGNQPIKDLQTGKIEIASHNHGFAVEADSLPEEFEITHINLNDGTVAGLRHKSKPVFCVQYHPESAPGPHDSDYLFDRFIDLIKSRKKEN